MLTRALTRSATGALLCPTALCRTSRVVAAWSLGSAQTRPWRVFARGMSDDNAPPPPTVYDTWYKGSMQLKKKTPPAKDSYHGHHVEPAPEAPKPGDDVDSEFIPDELNYVHADEVEPALKQAGIQTLRTAAIDEWRTGKEFSLEGRSTYFAGLRTLVVDPAAKDEVATFISDRWTPESNETADVTFVLPGGDRVPIKASVGETLLAAAWKNQIPIPAICGGGGAVSEDFGEDVACEFCHVYISKEHYDKLPTPSRNEQDMIDGLCKEPRSTSRCACRVVVTPELAGMSVALPPYGDSDIRE